MLRATGPDTTDAAFALSVSGSYRERREVRGGRGEALTSNKVGTHSAARRVRRDREVFRSRQADGGRLTDFGQHIA